MTAAATKTAPDTVRLSDTNPITGRAYYHSRFRDLPDAVIVLVEDGLGVDAKTWDQHVRTGAVAELVNVHHAHALAPLPASTFAHTGEWAMAIGLSGRPAHRNLTVREASTLAAIGVHRYGIARIRELAEWDRQVNIAVQRGRATRRMEDEQRDLWGGWHRNTACTDLAWHIKWAGEREQAGKTGASASTNRRVA